MYVFFNEYFSVCNAFFKSFAAYLYTYSGSFKHKNLKPEYDHYYYYYYCSYYSRT
jgi:hypothetical protein